MKLKVLGSVFLILFIIGFLTILTFVLVSSEFNPPVYSKKFVLNETWKTYKKEYLEEGTFRTLDKQRGLITTSEGQSYTMLRAVWMDDQDTFDVSWKWTKDNLQREDKLFAWLFGEKDDGSYGVINERGGNNTASDGDSDIALALIFAYSRWRNDDYLYDAIPIIKAIWDEEVVKINGKYYLAANNIEKESTEKIIINPSYLAPYTYKMFALIDKENPWSKVVDSSYEIINRSMEHNLDKKYSVNLVPDWIFLDRNTGDILNLYENTDLTSNYSYDAIRTPWRLALDWMWFKDDRAKNTLKKFDFLSQQWNVNRRILASYMHDGIPLASFESIATYGTSIGYFIVIDKLSAKEIYFSKLEDLIDHDTGSWKEILSYYDDNWAWFGLAMYYNELPNLAEAFLNNLD